jgi:ribosome-associated protein
MKAFELASACGALADEKKAKDAVIMHVADLTDIADYFLVTSGTSERHVRTIADSIETGMKQQDVRPYSVEGYSEGRWVIIDYGNVIVHIFLDALRELYDLESLWIEAKRYRIQNERKDTEVKNGQTKA